MLDSDHLFKKKLIKILIEQLLDMLCLAISGDTM